MNLHLPLVRETGAKRHQRDTLIQRARSLASKLESMAQVADADRALSPDAIGILHRSGLAMAPFGSDFGGEGLLGDDRLGEFCYILRLIGAADLSVARIFEGHVNAVALVCRHGTRQQISAFARDIEAGALSGVWGADDAKGLHAHEIADGWRLEGKKILASGAGLLRKPIVTATAASWQVLCLLDMLPGQRADISGWTAQGMRASATGVVELTGMIIRPEQLIGNPGDFMRQPQFSGGAWRFCAVHLGAMERLVDLFREHLVARDRAADPYQLQRVAQCIAASTTTRFWVEKAASQLAQGTDDPETIVALANMTRMVTERAALDVLEAVHRGVGLAGFIHPNPIERISRDLSTYLRQPVPDLAMSNAARAVLASAQPARDLWADHEG